MDLIDFRGSSGALRRRRNLGDFHFDNLIYKHGL